MNFNKIYQLSESKSSNLKNNSYAPELSDDTRTSASMFFDRYPNGTKESSHLDWNKHKSFTDKDFDFLDEYLSKEDDEFKFIQKSNREKKSARVNRKETPEEIFSDKTLFRWWPELSNENWFFVSPLSHEAAVFINSIECGGVGAKWCIGTSNSSKFWDEYIEEGSTFILAFNRHYDTLDNIKSSKGLPIDPEATNEYEVLANYNCNDPYASGFCTNRQLFTKFMIQLETPEDREVNIWSQPDRKYDNISLDEYLNVDFKVREDDIIDCCHKLYEEMHKSSYKENSIFRKIFYRFN